MIEITVGEAIRLIILTMIASTGFGIVFRIELKLLPLAALGGGLTRLVFILLQIPIYNRLVYSLLAAAFASLYAECMAHIMKKPATVFLYPSLVPLIPGDLIFYSMVGLMMYDTDMLASYASGCMQALSGMAIGFVLVFTIMHYKELYTTLFRRWRKKRKDETGAGKSKTRIKTK